LPLMDLIVLLGVKKKTCLLKDQLRVPYQIWIPFFYPYLLLKLLRSAIMSQLHFSLCP
jgi:hypothetical protein